MRRSRAPWFSGLRRVMRWRGSFVPQTAKTDCAVASALTVLNRMGRGADAVAVANHLDPERSGTDLETLRRFFDDAQGIPAQALAAPADQLDNLDGNVILHMTQQHYVVLLGLYDQGVLVFDPAMGPVWYPTADFAALYSGHALAIGKPAGRRPGAEGAVRHTLVGGATRRGFERVSLFLLGVAMRLLECGLLLCLVAVLFLVLNRASFPAILMSFALIAVCAVLLLLARQARFEGEDNWVRRQQSRIWRGLLRTSIGGRDLSGFRGRFERNVAAALRQGLIVTIPRKAQLPAALGSYAIMPVLLCLLSPLVALLHGLLYLTAIVAAQIDTVHVCRRSLHGTSGRYTPLRQSYDVLSNLAQPEVLGELAKWLVIGAAGLGVLMQGLPPMALMFWILAGMQIVALDFRKLVQLGPAFGLDAPVSPLMASEVEVRRQRVLGEPELRLRQGDKITAIEGIRPLTATLQQPDLTVREQRLIMADVVRKALMGLPEDTRKSIGAVRIFGPGQDASIADFEYLMIAREANTDAALPVPEGTRVTIERGLDDPVLRDLHSCGPDDFPVFWDFRGRMKADEIRARLISAGLRRAGHLTMSRLTIVEAA